MTELAGILGIKQPSLSRFLHRHGGMAWSTAKAVAKLVGRPVDDLVGPPEPRPGERLWGVTYGPIAEPPPEPLERAPLATMSAATFFLNARRMPGLEAWIASNPGAAVSTSDLAEIMIAWEALPPSARGDGSDAWWTAFVQSHRPTPPTPKPVPVRHAPSKQRKLV